MFDPQQLLDLTYFRGRVGLFAILEAMGIERGAHVAIQAFTCVAVPEAVMAAGLRPLFIDIERSGVNMDPADLRSKITPQTRAIVVQHTFGIPAKIDELLAVANERGIPVIEDCCHTVGGIDRGKTLGTLGAASFYSFEWGKPIVAGIGGSVIANDPALRTKLKANYPKFNAPPATAVAKLRAQFLAYRLLYRPSTYWYTRRAFRALSRAGLAVGNYDAITGDTEPPHFRLRMSDHHRANLSRELRHLARFTSHARELTRDLNAGIESPAITKPDGVTAGDVVLARYPLFASSKEELLAKAEANKVELASWYATPIHPLTGDGLRSIHYEEGSCPAAEKACGEIVSLPTHLKVSRGDVRRAIDFLNANA